MTRNRQDQAAARSTPHGTCRRARASAPTGHRGHVQLGLALVAQVRELVGEPGREALLVLLGVASLAGAGGR